jgi:hypothetical protein
VTRNGECKLDVSTYRIVLGGRIQKRWTDWVEGINVTWSSVGDSTVTVLECPTMDQAALHGVLARIRDLNLILLQVERSEPFERSSP